MGSHRTPPDGPVIHRLPSPSLQPPHRIYPCPPEERPSATDETPDALWAVCITSTKSLRTIRCMIEAHQPPCLSIRIRRDLSPVAAFQFPGCYRHPRLNQTRRRSPVKWR